MDITKIEEQTRQLGGAWAWPHSQRVLRLAQQIAEDLPYDYDALYCAVLLHDWGAFDAYRLPGVDHALRSRQIAEAEIFPALSFSEQTCAVIAEAIEKHDYRDPRPVVSAEALLLREADGLEMLGMIGAARELAWGPNDLAAVMARIRARADGLRGRFSLPAAQAIAAQRLRETDAFCLRIEAESLGWL